MNRQRIFICSSFMPILYAAKKIDLLNYILLLLKGYNMFCHNREFPSLHDHYKLRDYLNPASFCSSWSTPINSIFICSGLNGRYEFCVSNDNIIRSITYYNKTRDIKIEIDTFGDKSVPCIYLAPIIVWSWNHLFGVFFYLDIWYGIWTEINQPTIIRFLYDQ